MTEHSTAVTLDAESLVAAAIARGQLTLPEYDAKRLLAQHGITVPRARTGTDPTELAAELVAPLVLKAVSPTLVHKSDAGGVRVGLTAAEVDDAAATMTGSLAAHGHELTEFLIEEMAPTGHEVVVGAIRDPGVGWVVMLGLGGVLVEVLSDVAFGIAPLTRDEIADVLAELRGLPILQGIRGSEPANIDALITLVERLAGRDGLLGSLPPEVVEIDLNPVIVNADDAVAVDARFVVTPLAHPVRHAQPNSAESFERLFRPRSIAVLGASARKPNMGTRYIQGLLDSGYSGRILPIHPTADEIAGVPVCRSLSAVDGEIDYAYVALPAAQVADALAGLPSGKLHFAQVVSSGFAEVPEGVPLERDLCARLRRQQTRLLGPNCLGTHSTPGRFSFIPHPPMNPGGVAVVSQSGGLSVDILRHGAAHGVRFHSVTSIGNGADVTAADLARDLLADPDVSVVGLYLESLGAARDVLDVLRAGSNLKPVVLLAGGRTSDGSRAATSHTGALAGNHRLWPAVARQGAMALTDSLEEFVDVLLAFDTIGAHPFDPGDGAVVFGNGGGASVLAADALARVGLRTPALPEAAVTAIEALDLPPGNGLGNPIDTPAETLAVDGGDIAGRIMSSVLQHCTPAVVITHLNVGIIQRNLAQTHGDVTGRIIESLATARDNASHRASQVLVLKGDGRPDMDELIREYAERAYALGLPVYASVEAAASAVAAVLAYRKRRFAKEKSQ